MRCDVLLEARRRNPGARVRFFVGAAAVGSVAREHLPLLDDLRTPWLELHSDAVRSDRADAAAFAALHERLRAAGAIRAWRDEPYPLRDPRTLEVLITIERAASRFWGALTFGAHANGFVRGADGRPAALWIARRSPHKATDPGMLDNLVGGGVPAGQTPRETLVREGFEEAGLAPHQLADALAGSVLELARDIPEGFQHEWLYSFDVELPAGLVPRNQDGEVAGFELMALDDAAAAALGGEMTVDAALVTADFLVRHRLVADAALERCVQGLRLARK